MKKRVEGMPVPFSIGRGLRKLARGFLPFAVCLFPFAFAAAQTGDFLGRRVTSVDVVIDNVPGSSAAEMRTLVDVAAGQDYSPVRIHDSLVRLHRSGLISGASVEATPVGGDGVAIRFVVRPQARIDGVVFEGETGVPVGELRARLNELDPGERLSTGAVTRGQADLLAYYSARGFYKATVTPGVRLDPTGTRATVVYTVAPGEQARVSNFSLNVQGAKIDLSKLPRPVAEGQPFTQAAVQEMMDRLRDAYLAQDYLSVRVSQNTTPDVNNNTVAVAIDVRSGPKVTIEVEGLELSEKEKRGTLPFYKQGSVDEFSLEEGRRRLQDYAQRKGYFFAQVTRPDPPDLAAPTARLAYVVETGRRYRLSNIEIEGLDAIPHQTLEEEMKTKEKSPIPLPLIGNSRGITSDDMLRQDANLVLKRLREIGYRRAHVDVRRGVSPRGEDLIVTFDVQQGPRTYIEEVGIRGNNVLTTEELRQGLAIKTTDPLLASAVSRDTDRLLAAYNGRGYASAEVATELVELGSFDGQDRVRLLFDIRENSRVRIRNVATRGTAHTDPGRLERDFYLFKPGEWLRTDEIQETERQLYDTNAFTSVNITSE
ncbi:MAG TPA: POTRA domain-containing protein, partial [Blastocatellia bacterium]|nr:POTRA domain-containing protein [Blastocatellia bacterium]